MKIQKRDVKSIFTGIRLVEMTPDKYDQHFTYGLDKNKYAIRDEIEILNKNETEKLEKYNEAIDKLNEQYAEKSEEDKVIMNLNGTVKLPLDGIYEYNKELEKLNKKFKKEIDSNNDFLKEEIELPIYKIANKYFPDLEANIAGFLFLIRMDPDVEENEAEKKLKDEKKVEDEKKKK